MTIYKVTNIINGKVYIGQTSRTLARRWIQHCDLHSGCIALKRAIFKYGKENFVIESLFETNCLETLNSSEQKLISEFNSLVPNGYNITHGGKGKIWTEELKKRISDSNKGQKRTEETRNKISLALKGRTSPRKGKKLSTETVAKISASRKGKPWTEARYKAMKRAA